jgi:glyoxylase-like metal-dependent hydrolase (beta-lactamase superfamily II)
VGDAIHNAAVAKSGISPLVFWDPEQADKSIQRCVSSGAIIYPGHDLPFRVENGEVRYVGEFRFAISGVEMSARGLEFIGLGPRYLSGSEEGWEKGGGNRWVMPGIEEARRRLGVLD